METPKLEEIEKPQRKAATPPAAEPSSLRGRIKAIMGASDSGLNAFLKVKDATEAIIETWTAEGVEFICAKPRVESMIETFIVADGRIMEIGSESFMRFFSKSTGYNREQSHFKKITAELRQYAHDETTPRTVHHFSYYDPVWRMMAIADGTGRLLVSAPGVPWHTEPNGYLGHLITTEPGMEPITPEFPEAHDYFAFNDTVSMHLNGLGLVDTDEISSDDQRLLLRVALLQGFFPAWNPAKMVTIFDGEAGATKTSIIRSIGQLLFGTDFNVTILRMDKPDSLDAALGSQTLLGLDNVDERMAALETKLATWSTGGSVSLRELYTTNTQRMINFKTIWLMLTTRSIDKVNRPDLMQRALVLHCAIPRDGYITAGAAITVDADGHEERQGLATEVRAIRNRWWGSLLTDLRAIADCLPDLRTVRDNFRMADFRAFGHAVCTALLLKSQDDWFALCGRLRQDQLTQGAEGNVLIEVLRRVADMKSITGEKMRDLFDACNGIYKEKFADHRYRDFPVDHIRFSKRLRDDRAVIEKALDVIVTIEKDAHTKGSKVTFTRGIAETKPRARY